MNSYLARQVSKIKGTGLLIRPRPRARFEEVTHQDANVVTADVSLDSSATSGVFEERKGKYGTESGSLASGNDSSGMSAPETEFHPESETASNAGRVIIETIPGMTEKQDKKPSPSATGVEITHKERGLHPPARSKPKGKQLDGDAGPDVRSDTVQHQNRRFDRGHDPATLQKSDDRQPPEGFGHGGVQDPGERIHENKKPSMPPVSEPDRNDDNIVFLEQETALNPELYRVKNSQGQPPVNSVSQNDLIEGQPEMNISVEIGKVVIETPSPAPSQVFKKPGLQKPRLSLSQYLARRSGENR